MTHKPRVDTIIEFGKSSSPQYDRTVAKAARFPGYECVGEGRSMLHRIKILDRIELVKAKAILQVIRSWKSGAVYYKGDLLPWREVLWIIDCAKHVRNPRHIRWWCCEGYDLEASPPETFGCRWMRIGTSAWRSEAWYRWGEMVDAVRFKVDKKAITSLVGAKVAEDYLYLCPHFRLSRVLGVISRLPDVIDVDRDERWELRYQIHAGKEIPNGVRPKRTWVERMRENAEASVPNYPHPHEIEKLIRDVEEGKRENRGKDTP